MTNDQERSFLISLSGSPSSEFGDVTWEKSPYSGSQGNCPQFAKLAHGLTAVRDSKNASGPALVFTAGEMAALARGVKDGMLDEYTV